MTSSLRSVLVINITLSNHFVQVNFDEVYRKAVKPPFIPSPKVNQRLEERDVHPIGNENDMTDTDFEDF